MLTINLPMVVKILVALILLFIPSFVMGIPFPSGIRVIDNHRPDHVPWAWGINASLSVIATAMATLIAVEMGFRIVMGFAAAIYMLAFAVAFTTFAGGKKLKRTI